MDRSIKPSSKRSPWQVSHDKHKEKWGALWVVARVSPIDNWFIN
jgi:hypothetical protein